MSSTCEYTAAELAYATWMPRVFAASRTLTVPPMFTAVPYGGSALICGSSSAARWIDVRDRRARRARVASAVAVGDVALHERDLGVRGEPKAAVVRAEVEADDVDALLGEQRRRSTRRCSRARR